MKYGNLIHRVKHSGIGTETIVVLPAAYLRNFDSSNTFFADLDQLLIK